MFSSEDGNTLRLLQIVGLILLVLSPFHGTLEPWQWGVTLLLYFLGACVGGTMTYHRLLAHKSWRAPRWFEVFGTLCETLMLSGPSIAWVAVHREHHAKTDTDGDPHCPKRSSLLWIHFSSMKFIPNLRYAKDLLQDPFHRWVLKHYWDINMLYAAIIGLSLGPEALLYAYLFPAALTWQAGSLINSLNHLWGYQSYSEGTHDVNNPITGYLVFGEGWHNNHHAYPRDPYFGKRWWEFDIGGLLIKALRTDVVR